REGTRHSRRASAERRHRGPAQSAAGLHRSVEDMRSGGQESSQNRPAFGWRPVGENFTYPLFFPGRSPMTRSALRGAGLSAMLALALPVAPARAQTDRTFVSSTGNNIGNDCTSAANPCQTIGGALQTTASGGQITCLSPISIPEVGLAITKSVTIDCPTS